MLLKAQPNSLCGTRAVDRSVFIKALGGRLAADEVADSDNLPSAHRRVSANTLPLLPSDIQPVASQEICAVRG